MSKILHFTAEVPIAKGITSDDGDRLIYAPAASLKEDYDGETFEKAGLSKGLDIYFSNSRQVDYDHLYQDSVKKGKPDPSLLVGVAVRRQDVDGVPNVVIALKKANKLAQSIWQEMHDDPPTPFGLSVQGTAVKEGKLIKSCRINMITIAPCPKGTDTWVRVGEPPRSLSEIAKALAPMMAGAEDAPPPPETDVPEDASMQQKAAPEEVNYGPGDGIHICANCVNFDGTSACAVVQGRIRPQDTCDLYNDGDEDEDDQGANQGAVPPPPPGAQGAVPPPPQAPMPMARSIRGSDYIILRKSASPEETAATPHGTCSNCGGKTYCLTCHKSGIQKAYNTGEGVVGTDATDASALRKQELLGDYDPETGEHHKGRRRRKKKKKDEDEEGVSKSILIEQLRSMGYQNPSALADIIERQYGSLTENE